MTVQEMKKKKQEKGYTYAQIAELSGVPMLRRLSTLPAVFWQRNSQKKISRNYGEGTSFVL